MHTGTSRTLSQYFFVILHMFESADVILFFWVAKVTKVFLFLESNHFNLLFLFLQPSYNNRVIIPVKARKIHNL